MNLRFTFAMLLFVTAIAFAQDIQAQDGEWGHLSGTVTVVGDFPEPAPEKVGDHVDKPVCLVDGKIPADDNIVVNPENKGLRDVYVYMYLKKPKKGEEAVEVPVHPSYEEKKKEPVVLDNVKCRFVPHATFVRTGQTLVLKNSDPVGHNCHITTFKNEKNPTIPANDSAEVKFEESDTRPGNVTCDLHSWMDSVIFIRDNPYVAITDSDGKFTIENLPAGKWEFQFWHKKVGYMKTLVVENQDMSRRGVTAVELQKDKTVDLGTMKLPAEAFKK